MATESGALRRVEIGQGCSMYAPDVISDAAWRARYQRGPLGQTDRFVLASAAEMLLYALEQGHGVAYLRDLRHALEKEGPAR